MIINQFTDIDNVAVKAEIEDNLNSISNINQYAIPIVRVSS